VVRLYGWRLSSSILPCIGSSVLLGASSISCIVGDVACGVSSGVGWRVGYGISGSVGSKVDLLHYFIVTCSLFSHMLKGYCYDIANEGAPTYSWSTSLQLLYCILGLFL
jgi:hypothetical protein